MRTNPQAGIAPNVGGSSSLAFAAPLLAICRRRPGLQGVPITVPATDWRPDSSSTAFAVPSKRLRGHWADRSQPSSLGFVLVGALPPTTLAPSTPSRAVSCLSRLRRCLRSSHANDSIPFRPRGSATTTVYSVYKVSDILQSAAGQGSPRSTCGRSPPGKPGNTPPPPRSQCR